jgi:putative DNA primase/helicase
VWQKLRLARDREGNVRPPPTIANLLVVLGDDPRWSSRISYDAFRLEVCWDREPLTEEQATWLTAQLSHDYGIDTATGLVLEAIRAVAKDREFHPVRDWLGALKWDGTERVRDLLLLGFGAKPEGDEDLVRLLGERFMLSLLARAFEPGVKVDTMLVLQGAQGSFKSTSFEVLVGKQWFSRSKMDLASKDAFMQLRGKWLFELAEMSAVRKVEDHASKSFLSTDTDNFRAPYARRAEDHPRQTVFCGTTNEEEFLQDPTGWRRYWPATVTKANLAWLREHREQLFAEAMVLRAAGRQWWFDEGTEEAERLRVWAQPYRVVHPWTDHVRKWLASPQAKGEFTVVDVITGALSYAIGDVTHNDQTAMGAVLRDLKCVKLGRRRHDGAQPTLYRRPEGMEPAGKGASVTLLPPGRAKPSQPSMENNQAGG